MILVAMVYCWLGSGSAKGSDERNSIVIIQGLMADMFNAAKIRTRHQLW
jgi:hypothetical protein